VRHKQAEGGMAPWEAMIPIGIIVGAITAMGGLQGGLHKLFSGKPKPVQPDRWDLLMAERDRMLDKQTKET